MSKTIFKRSECRGKKKGDQARKRVKNTAKEKETIL